MDGLAGAAMDGLAKAALTIVKLIKYEWFLNKTVKTGLTSLQTELKMMQGSVENVFSVPEDQIKPVDKIWASEITELSCTIETGLHSFMSRIDSTNAAVLAAGMKRVINHEIASFIEVNMTKAKEVGERRGRYDFSSSNTTSAQEAVDPRIYALYTKRSDLVGLDEATVELSSLLSNFDHVSIFGMGGLGKTTLAREVFDKMKGEFGCCAFVPVGQNAIPKKVLMDILHELRMDIYGREPGLRQLIDQLRNSLMGKRCLFVIDDIWDNEIWDLIKHALVGSPESRIITTTRKHEVAKKVGCVYKMKRLSDLKSKELLHATFGADRAKSHDTEFARLSEKVLSRCGGVPLAIITIARLLAKRPRNEWSTLYDAIGFAEHGKEDVVKAIRNIVSLSYKDLRSDLKKCFLYLSQFPEDHWIEKNMLIWRWVAEGLVPGFELGEANFNELIDRCMIERAVSPRDLGQGGCRIHDMILDFIRDQSSSEKENFSTVLDGKKERTPDQALPIHRLAIHGKRVDETQDNNVSPPQKTQDTSLELEVGTVQSFYASSCPGSSLPKFSKFAVLRVIDLEKCDLSVGGHKLKHIAKSRELAYVGLLGTPVAELPKKIGGLKFLQTLDVTGTGIQELPRFVGDLKKLRCLRAGKGTRMMCRVGELASLEELWLHSADKSPDFAAELRKLAQLRVLVIHLDEMEEGMQEALVESLREMKRLQILQVWSDAEEKFHLPVWEGSVPSPNLRQLLLFGVIVPRPMPWIHQSCVPELSKLLLEVETLEAAHLEVLGQMPSLLSLYLHSEDNRLSYTAGKDEFKVLEYLYTNIELVCGDGALPVIQELEVAGVRVGTDVGLRGNMPLLEKASYHLDCNKCLPDEVRKAEESLKEAASEGRSNRPALSIHRFNTVLLDSAQTLGSMFAEVSKMFCAGDEVQTDIKDLLLTAARNTPLVDHLSKASAEPIVGPPTLAAGDVVTGSPSLVIKNSNDNTLDSLCDSMELEKLTNLFEGLRSSLTQNPEFVAAKPSADWFLDASERSRLMPTLFPVLISQIEQSNFLGNVLSLLIPSSAQAGCSTADTQEGNRKLDEIGAKSLPGELERATADHALPGVPGTEDRFVELFDYCMRMAGISQDAVANLAWKQPAENSGAGVSRESLPEVFQSDSLLSWFNTPDGAAFLLKRAATWVGMADPTGQLASSMDSAASSSASAAPGRAVQQTRGLGLPPLRKKKNLDAPASTGQPSSKPDNVGKKP